MPSQRGDRTVHEGVARLCREGARPVLRLSGGLDVATATTVRAALDDACQDTRGEVLVDLSGVEFFDAATIGIFAQANARLRKQGGRLTLLGLTSHQEKVVRLCFLEGLLAVAVARSGSSCSLASVKPAVSVIDLTESHDGLQNCTFHRLIGD